MKILSINADETTSKNQIALNVDQDLTPEFLAQLEYGDLRISAWGTVLTVEKNEGTEAFSKFFVTTLQKKLDHIQAEIDKAAQKRQAMLKELSMEMELSLG